MFGKKDTEEKERIKKLEAMWDTDYVICPYCNTKIDNQTSAYQMMLQDGMVNFVACPHCKKVLSATTEL